jgi:hypothetical protein
MRRFSVMASRGVNRSHLEAQVDAWHFIRPLLSTLKVLCSNALVRWTDWTHKSRIYETTQCADSRAAVGGVVCMHPISVAKHPSLPSIRPNCAKSSVLYRFYAGRIQNHIRPHPSTSVRFGSISRQNLLHSLTSHITTQTGAYHMQQLTPPHNYSPRPLR